MNYHVWASRQPAPDIWELSHAPRQIAPYEPRACDVVPFEADEQVQHVVLSTPRTAGQTPANGAHGAPVAISAQSDGAGRARQMGPSDEQEAA